LYNKPLELRPGQLLLVRACRLGYADSPTVHYRCGEKPPAPAPAEKATQWREKLDKSGLIARLLKLKSYDGRWREGEKAYLRALSDEAAAMRYWAVVGLDQAYKDAAPPDGVKKAVAAVLNDPSWSVSSAAAQAMIDWGEEQKGLARLVEVLQNAPDKGAIYAAWALWYVGEKARPVLKAIEGVKLARYPQTVLSRVIDRLKKSS
ncbi:MAG: hypothetical protein J7M21_01555, partial [Planctomycetes bacterium]|nr:hypothetical protein [Planctomycetota bacterium]